MPIRLAGDWAPKTVRVMPLQWHDLAVINLEGPVLDAPLGYEQKQKAGPCLYHTSLPSEIERVVYSLANNHIMDYGAKGLDTTFNQIYHSKAYHCGAAQNLNASRKPLILEHEGMKVGIISRCETQFGIASTDRPGACPIDATIHQTIKDLGDACDLLIVSLHAAAEMSPWPSPSRQDLCRALIDSGAHIVHGHHSHIPQGWEEYKHGFIFYGLGNLCVDPTSWSTHANAMWSSTPRLIATKTMLDVEIKTSTIESLEAGIVEIRDSSSKLAELHGEYLRKCNHPLADRPLLEGLWQETSIDLYLKHFGPWLGQIELKGTNKEINLNSFRALGSRAKQFIKKHTQAKRLAVRNQQTCYQQMLWYHLFACESHCSAISTALGVLSGVTEDLRSDTTANLIKDMQGDPS